MEIPEKIGIHFYISKGLSQEVTAKRNPIVGTDRCEVCHIIPSLNNLRVSDAVPFDEEAGKLQEKNKKERSDILFFCPKLIRAKDKPAKDGHGAAHQDEKTEEFKEEIEKRPNGTRLEHMSESKKREIFTEFNKVTCGEPFDHIHNKSGYETENQKRMR